MTEPRGPIDWANQQQTERQQRATEQPVRYTADRITDNALDQLYAERDEARAAADRYFTNGTKAVEELNWRAHNAEQRAEQAEAAIARILAFCDELDASIVRLTNEPAAVHPVAAKVRYVLVEPKEPRP